MSEVLEGRTADGRGVRVRFSGDGIEEITDHPSAPDLLLIPGLVDIQLNGYGGLDVNDPSRPASELADLVRALWGQGVTTVYPTIISADDATTTTLVKRAATARANDSDVAYGVPGLHLEGPYISSAEGARGAHDPAVIRDPDADEFDRWQAAADGAIAIMTLAPERQGAIEFTRHLVQPSSGPGAERAVVPSVGHSLATAADVHAFAAAGGRLSTHLGNGLPAQIDRHDNPIWPQLTEDALTAGLIADGHHLPADTFAALVRAKGPGRCVLTSDAAALAGCAPGDYQTAVGGAVTVGSDGSLRLQGTPYLAGSGASLLDCLRWATGPGGLPLETAVTMATTTPADLLGLHNRGRLEVGARADLVQLTSTPDRAVGDLVTVVVNGRLIASGNS
ncbi:N-acetylglucosamine-6-phosphate deacetylase [Kribbella sp. VKM Ac-2571]|uniref:N-acetylglucosamine-6-phosphate deacetylase n=1 Tax=Kribbella sp. VKM Ac-2571 TaxID=2512222 RepID=UPI0010613F80|nr:amidohydrolase family protein [Kribbella sp. VKM Ac-2571]TDO52934.1 N-acetylglucosamine-6-phosphate deacetylase [Kribbella sp. VKM Ac-2571]